VPTEVLHDLPWPVLPSCRDRPLTVSPSATMWHRAATAVPAVGPVVVAAGPLLPGADREARSVGRVHGVQPLLGPAATVAGVLAALNGAAVAHLATHGRLSAGNPLFSQLSDGPLFAYDLERLAVMPGTVVLAACEGGRSVARAADEVLGLSATLLAQGSTQLVAPVLPIPDVATAPFMTLLHQLLRAGRPPAEALTEARGQLDDDAASAAFLCFGGGFAPLPAPEIAVSGAIRASVG
jgi:CHAT domain-containing protein